MNTTKENLEERRRYERVPVKLAAEILSAGDSFPGTVNDLSISGLQASTSSPKSVSALNNENSLEIKIQPPSGNEISIKCKLIWAQVNKIPLHGISCKMGVEVLDPPPAYSAFIESMK